MGTDFDAGGPNLVWMGRGRARYAPERGEGTLHVAAMVEITRAYLEDNGIAQVVLVAHPPEAAQGVMRLLEEAERAGGVGGASRFAVHRFPFLDADPGDQPEGADRAAGAAVAVVKTGVQVGVHTLVACEGGMHRSPAVAAVALAALGHFPSPLAAFDHVRRHRTCARYEGPLVEWVAQAARTFNTKKEMES